MHTASLDRIVYKSKNEQESMELLRESILAAANINAGSYSGWKYAPIDRVSRFLYEIPFNEIPIKINHEASDPSKVAILKWRLSVAHK